MDPPNQWFQFFFWLYCFIVQPSWANIPFCLPGLSPEFLLLDTVLLLGTLPSDPWQDLEVKQEKQIGKPCNEGYYFVEVYKVNVWHRDKNINFFFKLGYQFIITKCNLGTARWKRGTRWGVEEEAGRKKGGGRGVEVPRTSTCPPIRKFHHFVLNV